MALTMEGLRKLVDAEKLRYFLAPDRPALMLNVTGINGRYQFMIILDVDGQIVKYSHGPQVPQAVQWPGPRGSTQVRIQLTPPATRGMGPFEGPWALFRMFDQVKIESTPQAEKFVATFVIDGRQAQFEVIASSVRNPFRLQDLEQFQCPGGL